MWQTPWRTNVKKQMHKIKMKQHNQIQTMESTMELRQRSQTKKGESDTSQAETNAEQSQAGNANVENQAEAGQLESQNEAKDAEAAAGMDAAVEIETGQTEGKEGTQGDAAQAAQEEARAVEGRSEEAAAENKADGAREEVIRDGGMSAGAADTRAVIETKEVGNNAEDKAEPDMLLVGAAGSRRDTIEGQADKNEGKTAGARSDSAAFVVRKGDANLFVFLLLVNVLFVLRMIAKRRGAGRKGSDPVLGAKARQYV
eukprot:TRINITY_DN3228_c0_g2_i7.p1 TRINITY_DN3228_c0_g2~~TRINITY_DN3228_c0_g2_i7.p1  ORF type:complete len:257 (+),score=55.40 TRINITY_DN3228_c0_g2_i7:152-922(+)